MKRDLQIIAVRKGGRACDARCLHYEESGFLQGFGGKLKARCRGVMEPIFVDCHEYDPNTTETLEVTAAEWDTMKKAIGRKAKKARRIYKKEHEEIHPVGWNWKNEKKIINP